MILFSFFNEVLLAWVNFDGQFAVVVGLITLKMAPIVVEIVCDSLPFHHSTEQPLHEVIVRLLVELQRTAVV